MSFICGRGTRVAVQRYQTLSLTNTFSRTSCCHHRHTVGRLESSRNFNNEALTAVPYKIIHVAEHFFEGIHHYTYLPWWAVIVCSTVVFRSMLTLPLAVYQNKIIAKMELLFPTLKEYQEAVKHNIIVKARQAGMTHTEANRWIMKEVSF